MKGRILSFLPDFEKHLKGRGYKDVTVQPYLTSITLFASYLRGEGVTSVFDLSERSLLSFAKYVHQTPFKGGKKLSTTSANIRIRHVKQFCTWLYRCDFILVDIGQKLSYTKKEIRPEKAIFSVDEINAFLDSVEDTLYRTIFEFMYATGLRISEVVALNIHDINLVNRVVMVRHGKGDKDRSVPLHQGIIPFLKTYLHSYRSKQPKSAVEPALFLSAFGRLKQVTITKAFHRYLEKAELQGRGLTPHSIRHSVASHLLQEGADIRYVQEMLGHESIETTARYTHVGGEHLKRAYKEFHPRENDLFVEVDDEYLQDVEELISFIKAKQETYK
jgi:integrase/recombinase XerD